MTPDLSRFFDRIPIDRVLSGCSAISDETPDFSGSLGAAIAELGAPTIVILHLEPVIPTWRCLWRAEWADRGTLWGIFDPTSFIVLFNLHAKVVSQTNVLFSVQTPKNLPAETIVLTDSFQPQAVIWTGRQFETAPFFFRQTPPAPPRAVPAFMR